MDNKKKHLVAIIVVGTNEAKWLKLSFGTLNKSLYENQVIIYVDNNSSDGSIDIVQKNFPNVKIIKNSCNIGFAAANNRGIDLAYSMNADYIFFVNPDTKTPAELVGDLVKFMESNKDFGVIGPLQLNYNALNNGDLNEWSLEALRNGNKDVFSIDLPDYNIDNSWRKSNKVPGDVVEHFYVQGAAMFIRANIKNFRINFDPIYHTFYEEIDLCRKIGWQGLKVGILKNKFIYHKGGGSTSISNYKKYHMIRNKYIYLLTDTTWETKMTFILISRWIKNDLRSFKYSDIAIYLKCAFSLIASIPKIICRRYHNFKMTEGIKTSIKMLK